MNNLTDKINEIEGASKNLEALLRNRTIASRQTRALNKDLRNGRSHLRSFRDGFRHLVLMLKTAFK